MRFLLRLVIVVMLFSYSAVCLYAQDRSPSKPDAADYTPVKILQKPRAAYPTSERGTVCMTGNVRLKVTFLSTGEIGAITPVTRLPYGATENAIAAAKQMKFVPAQRDGRPVTSVKSVDYSFTIY